MHFTVREDSKYKYTEKWKTCMSAGMERREWGSGVTAGSSGDSSGRSGRRFEGLVRAQIIQDPVGHIKEFRFYFSVMENQCCVVSREGI